MHFLAYFQSYTNTYADVAHLRSLYEEALKVNKVVGLVISTRPDCMGEDVLDLLEEISKKTLEEKIKEETNASTRCIPFDGGLGDTGKCIFCKKDAQNKVLFAKSY